MGESIERNIDLSTFKKNFDEMVIKSEKIWKDSLGFSYRNRKIKEYSKEEVESIINSGSLSAQQALSRNYFYKDSIYRRIIIYYATILKYIGILIPNPSAGNSLSTPYILKRYNAALDYLDKIGVPELLTKISLRALIDGCYYGILQNVSKTEFVLLDLPAEYCRSNFRDFHGNDIIEFNVLYFNSIIDEDVRKQALKVYPKQISDHYRRYIKNQVKTPWARISTDIGLCFSFSDDNCPFFLDLITATIDYDDAVETNKERDLEEIRKIIVQKIPHLSDGMLLFEPPEAEVMHAGAVGMMKGNKNISVLTTYADVDSVVSNTASEASTNALEKSLQNVYANAGVSGQLFAPTGSQALMLSIKNDISFMMILGNKYSRFLTFIVNSLFSNSNISFKYTILPVSYYDSSDYIVDSFKLAQSGYSFLLPALALGITQKDLINLKDLENDALDLIKKLQPLESAYTQSAGTGKVGRPELPLDQKSEKTIQNEQSLDNNGGSNG